MGKNTVAGLRLAGERRRILNDLSRFSYSHFLPFTARTHSHKYNGLYTKKRGGREEGRGREGGREAKARVSEPFAEGGMSFSAVFNGGDRGSRTVVARSPRWRKISNTKYDRPRRENENLSADALVTN